MAHRVQDDGVDGIAPQLLERGDALVTVDDQILRSLRDDDDGRLLPGFGQGAEEPPEAGGVADLEMFQAAVQLMKFQGLGHGVGWPGFQYGCRGNWSFARGWGCCVEPL